MYNLNDLVTNLYIFLFRLRICIKAMSEQEFLSLLVQCNYEHAVYALYFRYLWNEVENSKLNILIKTSDRLMRVANKNIVSMVLSELDEEDRKDIDISEYLSCYSRVRTG